MEQRTLTPVTDKTTTVQSRIRSELGNFPSSTTKFTVVHRRPVFCSSLLNQQPAAKSGKAALANIMCRFVHHPVAASAKSTPSASVKSLSTLSQISSCSSTTPVLVTTPHNKASANQINRNQSAKKVGLGHLAVKPALKRSLSADHLDVFQPAPTKRPFPVQIWFNKQSRGPRLPVATAFWLDSPLHDSQAFVYTKLLEASQARRYLQLQSKPRKYLHLTGGWIAAVNNPPPSSRKPEIMLPPMTVKTLPPVKASPSAEKSPATPATAPPPQRKKSPTNQLPPPPPLISLRPTVPKREVSDTPPPQQDHPLELCKRRKQSDESSGSPDSPRILSATCSPLNLAVKATTNGISSRGLSLNIKRKIALPPSFALPDSKSQQEPLDLATPSPTTVFNRMTLTDTASPTSPLDDKFRERLLLVLQVLLGDRRLVNLGHPEVPVDEILAKILKKAEVVPAKTTEVRANWLKFLRLCVKNEDAWKHEGWDRKTPEAILDEIYMQDVIPIIRKTGPSRVTRINAYLQEGDAERNAT